MTAPDSIRELCALTDPYASADGALFARAMRENVEWHAARSAFYRRVLEGAGLDPKTIRTESDCARIPFIPANFFKAHELLSIAREEVVLHLTSSGTQGQKSQMFFDRWSLAAGQAMVDAEFSHFGLVSEEPANYLLYTYETEADSKLGTAYTDNYLCKFAPVNEAFYALRRTGRGGHDFDVFGAIERLRAYEKQGLPVRILGFPAFLFFTLERMRDLKLPPLKLNAKSLVVLGGGWKGNADRAIAPRELYERVVAQLGIPDARVRDSFGAVEHAVPYTECERHRFHVPVWSRVLIRDVRKLEPVGMGERGFLQFLTPYITSVPAQSVLMGDLAALYEGCDCGIRTPYFVIHGRAGTSKNKSCAMAASELLK
jgi:phenylacetate-coenzyme A ligase PaaK-like adenylate-forming protein